mgnify:CR=1 FL=1
MWIDNFTKSEIKGLNFLAKHSKIKKSNLIFSKDKEIGLLNLFIISRLVDANFLEQLLGVGDASIQQLFSRDPGLGLVNRFFDSRVDGDYAQACSINTEFGVLPYLAGNYEDEVAVGDSLFGVWFTGSTVSPYNTVGTTVADRRIVGPGELTFSEDPLLVSNFNYIDKGYHSGVSEKIHSSVRSLGGEVFSLPEFHSDFYREKNLEHLVKIKKLKFNFEYSSNKNIFLNTKEIKKLIQDIDDPI